MCGLELQNEKAFQSYCFVVCILSYTILGFLLFFELKFTALGGRC